MKNSVIPFIILLGFILAGTTGCEKLGLQKIDPTEAEARNQRSLAMRVADRYKEAWNSRNAKEVAALYAEDAVMYGPDSPQPVTGRANIEKSLAGLFRAFPEMQAEIITSAAEGNKLFIEGRTTGTNSGPMAGPQGEMPATNRKIDLRYVMVATLTDSLISEDRTYYNPQEMATQLYPNGMPVTKKAAPAKKKKRR